MGGGAVVCGAGDKLPADRDLVATLHDEMELNSLSWVGAWYSPGHCCWCGCFAETLKLQHRIAVVKPVTAEHQSLDEPLP